MTSINTHQLTITINPDDHTLARQFATQQDTQEKGKQVYFNTLAICAVNSFLELIGVAADLNQGDSWNPAIRCFHNVADLVIPSLGRLECRPILDQEKVIFLPPEVTEDRIAYIAVQFQEHLHEVQLLGFSPVLSLQDVADRLEIVNLQPIEELIDYLFRLELANDFLQSDDEVADRVREQLNEQSPVEIIAHFDRIYQTYNKNEWRDAGGELLAGLGTIGKGISEKGSDLLINREEIDELQQIKLQDLAEELLEKLSEIWSEDSLDVEYLRQWLEGVFRQDWQEEEKVPAISRSRRGDRAEQVSRAKLIELGEHIVALLVSVISEVEDEFDIQLRLYPAGTANSLPTGVKLIAVDAEGEVIEEVEARSNDTWIQLGLSGGEIGDRFDIIVAIGDIIVTENMGI